MENFRCGQTTRFQALTNVVDELDKWSGATDDEREHALNSYLPELKANFVDTNGNGNGSTTQPSQSSDSQKKMISPTINQNLEIRKRKMNCYQEENKPGKKICHGTHLHLSQPEEVFVSEHVTPCDVSAKTFQEPSPSFVLPITYQMEFQPPNGIESSVVNPSTLTKSSPQCTLSTLMKRERVAWATLKSSLQFPKQNAKSELVLNGQPPFEDCQKQSPFFSPTRKVNLEIIPSISRVSLLPNKPGPMEKSSFLTNQSETKSGEDKMFYSQISKGSKILAKPFCIPTESNIAKEDQADLGELTRKPRERKTKFAEGFVEIGDRRLMVSQ
jgi:hypothetical protein